jgi:hypothetical protein
VRHIWAPSAGFVISDKRQERIALKEVGLVEYRFTPDSFEVRHVRPPGMVDVDLDELLKPPACAEEKAASQACARSGHHVASFPFSAW